MAVKKIIKIITIFLISYIALSLFLYFLFNDIPQYKQIGDTHFYIIPGQIENQSLLYHDAETDDMFYRIDHEGSVHDVFWNQQYIIIKCNEEKEEHWYIMNNVNEYNWPKFNQRHFVKESDYKHALDSLNLRESDMGHSSGNVPWRPHLSKNI